MDAGEQQLANADAAEPTSEGEGFVQADAPIQHRSQDRLNRVHLADAIADQVIYGPKGHGLVIGVAGKWGSGKTSVLRMVEESVRERSQTVLVRFNPWLFSSAEELVSRFLTELAWQLKAASAEGEAQDILRRAGDQLATYAESLEPFGWIPIFGPWLARAGALGKAYNAIRKKRDELPSAEAQREQVSAELLKLDRRVLVVIDDLDRIEPGRVRDMVRLVKLVGEFPIRPTSWLSTAGPSRRRLATVRERDVSTSRRLFR